VNKLPPVKNAPDRSFERKQPIPGAKKTKVSVRRVGTTEAASPASVLEAEVETWVNEGGAGDEPGNAPTPSTIAK
jgi:hypothetical protein